MHALMTAAPILGAAIEGLRVYLAGSMRTRRRWDVDGFAETAARLRELKAVVHVPTEHRLRVGLDPDDDLREVDGAGQMVEGNLDPIFDSDVVAMMPGWQESGEAVVVKVIAESLGVPVVRVEDLFRLSGTGHG